MRPCGGFTPDMINFAHSTNVYKIWADMVAFGKTDMPVGEHSFCAYAGRRDGKPFRYSHQEILEKYRPQLRMVERIPDVLADAMGNQMYLAVFPTQEGLNQFYHDVLLYREPEEAAGPEEPEEGSNTETEPAAAAGPDECPVCTAAARTAETPV